MPSSPQAQAEAHAAAERKESAQSPSLSLSQRGEHLLAACRSASQIYQSRLAAGLPIEDPAPWPASTWEFLKTQASHVRQSSNS